MMRVMQSRQDDILRGIQEIRQSNARRLQSHELHVDRPSVAIGIGRDRWGRSTPHAPVGGGRVTPGAGRVREVVLVAPDERVFGRSLSGLGNACTGSGAQVTAAMFGSGTSVATAYMSGTLAGRVSGTSTSNLDAVLDPATKQALIAKQTTTSAIAGLGETTSPSTELTQAQKIGAAFSVLGTAITSSWSAACQARQGTTAIGDSAAVGANATSQAITTIQSSRQSSSATTIDTEAASGGSTTSSGGSAAQASTASDDKKMLYIGGGIVAVAVIGLILMR